MNGRFPAHLVSMVSDRTEISELSATLMNTARKDWMTLETLDTEMPLTDDFAELPLPTFAGAVRCGPSTPGPRWTTRPPGESSKPAPKRESKRACCLRCR